VANGFAELTIPEAPTAGLDVVFWLGSGARTATVVGVLGSAVSSPTEPSSEEAGSSEAPASRGASSWVAGWVPQEARVKSINTAKSSLAKIRSSINKLPDSVYHKRRKTIVADPVRRVILVLSLVRLLWVRKAEC